MNKLVKSYADGLVQIVIEPEAVLRYDNGLFVRVSILLAVDTNRVYQDTNRVYQAYPPICSQLMSLDVRKNLCIVGEFLNESWGSRVHSSDFREKRRMITEGSNTWTGIVGQAYRWAVEEILPLVQQYERRKLEETRAKEDQSHLDLSIEFSPDAGGEWPSSLDQFDIERDK